MHVFMPLILAFTFLIPVKSLPIPDELECLRFLECLEDKGGKRFFEFEMFGSKYIYHFNDQKVSSVDFVGNEEVNYCYHLDQRTWDVTPFKNCFTQSKRNPTAFASSVLGQKVLVTMAKGKVVDVSLSKPKNHKDFCYLVANPSYSVVSKDRCRTYDLGGGTAAVHVSDQQGSVVVFYKGKEIFRNKR